MVGSVGGGAQEFRCDASMEMKGSDSDNDRDSHTAMGRGTTWFNQRLLVSSKVTDNCWKDWLP